MNARDDVSIERLEDDALSREAGSWLLELQSADLSAERIAEWQRWLAANTAHREAFDELQSLWQSLDRIPETRWPTAAQVGADRHQPSQSVASWRRQSRERKTTATRRIWWGGALATAAAVLAGVGWHVLRPVAIEPTLIETAIGERRQITLADGSAVSIGAASRLRISLLPRRREAVLEQGEAYFEVAKDPARPFSVHAGSTAVMVVGTAFNVKHVDTRVTVAVAEGTVDVEEHAAGHAGTPRHRLRLAVGHRVTLAERISRPVIESVPIEAVASWRGGRLVFSDEPLATVVADMNRYAYGKLRIGDAALAELRVTGTVSNSNIDSWLESLEQVLPIEAVAHEDGTTSLIRAPTQP